MAGYSNGDKAMTVLDGFNLPSTERTSSTSFLAKARNTNWAWTERFECHVMFPRRMRNEIVQLGYGSESDPVLEAALLCEEVQIPGMTLANKEVNIGNWQFYRNTNIGFLGNEINITFYSDADWSLRHVFEAWMSHCVDANSKEVAWPDDSFGEITINQLDKQNKITAQWELMECMPKVLNLVPLSMGAVSIARTTLIISSAYWRSKAIDINLERSTVAGQLPK